MSFSRRLLFVLVLVIAARASEVSAELLGYGTFEMGLDLATGRIEGSFAFGKHSYFRSGVDYHEATLAPGPAGRMSGGFLFDASSRGTMSLTLEAGVVGLETTLCRFRILDKDESDSPTAGDRLEFKCRVDGLLVDEGAGLAAADVRGVELRGSGTVSSGTLSQPVLAGKFVIGRR